MKTEVTVSDAASQMAADARILLAATANVAEEKVMAARNRLHNAFQNGKEVLAQVQDKAIAGAKATDKTVREYPYQAIGVALGVGALVGFFFGRRS